MTVTARWLALVAVGLVLSLATPGSARAHERDAQRTVVVQVEDTEVLILVQWTAPTGVLAPLMAAHATLLGRERARDALVSLLTRRALGGLRLEIDGAVVPWTSPQSKLTVGDRVGSALSVTVLAAAPLPSAHRVRVAAADGEQTRITWSDRSERYRIGGAIGHGQWALGGLQLELSPESGTRASPTRE